MTKEFLGKTEVEWDRKKIYFCKPDENNIVCVWSADRVKRVKKEIPEVKEADIEDIEKAIVEN
jgi:hypothetical protein